MKHDKFDLEGELRDGRSVPRADFAEALAEDVRRTRPSRAPRSRLGSALALSGLILVAVASFGGIGYASSNGAKKQPNHVWVVKGPSSAAAAQYGTTSTTTTVQTTTEAFTPPTTSTTVPKATSVAGGTESAQGTLAAPKAKTAQLPFTGLALWVPLAIGLVLISFGLVLRTRGRRRDAAQ
jgi:hypothetical protein